MSDTAIQVRGLGKQYRIGQRQLYKTFREAIASAVRAPLRRLRQPINPAGHESFWALKGVSLEVKRGEVIGVIGRNGAGKSTLLKILSGITEPTEGEAVINGRVGSLLEVGTGFHPELTGRENIYLNGAILGMKRSEIARKFDEIIAFAETEKFLDTPVKHYSSGMYTRLAFAVAAHLQPEILVVDEVLAVGDAEFQKKCLGKMGQIAHEGRTVLFVSHNMNAVEQLCSKALMLRTGKVYDYSSDVRGIVRRYIFGDSSEASPSAWTNPGNVGCNPYFRPLRFELVGERGEPLHNPLRNDEPAWVRIEAEIESTDPALTMGYAIYSESGETVYWSYQTDSADNDWPRLERGRVVLQSRLPKRLFNEGNYRVELIGGLHHRAWLFEPGTTPVSVYMTIQGGLSDSPYWMQKRPGLLAPVIKWDRIE